MYATTQDLFPDPDLVMLLGDGHGNITYYNHAIQLAVQARTTTESVIVQAGDFGLWDHVKPGVEFLKRLNGYLLDNNVWMLFVDGNHENFDSLYERPVLHNGLRHIKDRIWHIPRGTTWEWNNSLWLGLGGAHSIDGPGGAWTQARGPGRGWWPQETITNDDVQTAVRSAAAHVEPVDFMVTHDCPWGVPLGLKGYPAGDEHRRLLREAVDKVRPRHLVHGHYHRHHEWDLDGTHIVGLAHDGTPHGGQYCWATTADATLHVPDFT